MAWGNASAGWDAFAPTGRFGGIPPELQDRVDAILVTERLEPVDPPPFSHGRYDRRPFTLRRFLAPFTTPLLGALALVVLETLAIQAGPLLTQRAIDHGVVARDKGMVVTMTVAYLVTIVAGTIASSLRISVTGRVGARLTAALRVRLFSHLQRLSLDFFTREKAGVLMSRMTSDLESLHQLFNEGLVNLAVQGLTLVVVSAILFALDPLLAAVTLFAIVPIMVALTLWFRSASSRAFTDVRDRIADVLAHLQESLGGIRIITAYNRRRQNIVEHRNVLGVYRDANDRTARINAVYGPGTEVLGLGTQTLLLAVGGAMVLDGDLTIGELTAFVLYLSTFFAPLQQLVQLYNLYQQGQAAITKLQGLLAEEPSVVERADAYELPPIEGAIRLDSVTFGYGDELVLRGVDLEIAPGETFALVGPTGAGKSTIAKLVTRFYDPRDGRVLIDGHDLRGVTLESLRRQLGVVPQEPFLFGGSIRDNVAFARPGATDEEVWEACRTVGIDDLVERLPEGLHTPCHERGVSLSSGERQLLALARAFLAHPRVLVLDEATSNLDLRSESKIERALDVLLEGRTAIVIAHRLQTAMRADRIAVVDDGGIVELGTHDELVARGGRYAEMYRMWQEQAAQGADGGHGAVPGGSSDGHRGR
jgi:ATP-binding cassette subfamily B protein